MFFKTKHNVPDIYTEDSRDFQYISAVCDLIYNYIINNTEKIISLKSTSRIDETLLVQLCDYLGFNYSSNFTATELRSILINFPYIIKNKGNLTGIQYAVNALYLANNYVTALDIKLPVAEAEDKYVIDIISDVEAPDKSKINHVLDYVRPIGFKLNNIYKFQNEYTGSLDPDAQLTIDTKYIDYVNIHNSTVSKSDTLSINSNAEDNIRARVGLTRIYDENQTLEE